MLHISLPENLMIRLEEKDLIGARETKVEIDLTKFYGWVNILYETVKKKMD